MSPAHTMIVSDVSFEPALEVAPVVMEWTTDGFRYFDLYLPASHREHYLRIDMQTIDLSDERAVVTIVTNVYTVKRRHRRRALGQCASVVAIFAGIPAVSLLWNETLGDTLRSVFLGILAGWYLVPAALRSWRG